MHAIVARLYRLTFSLSFSVMAVVAVTASAVMPLRTQDASKSKPIVAQREDEDGPMLLRGGSIPGRFSIPAMTLSPDKRYGFLVPDRSLLFDSSPEAYNALVEVATGRELARVKAETGFISANHMCLVPCRWSEDGQYVLWRVSGKWSDWALVLMHIEDGQVKWQKDLLITGQQELLKRTRARKPRQYAIEKEENKGDGSAYPDGFTVDVQVEDKNAPGEDEDDIDGKKFEAWRAREEGTPLRFPLHIRVYLTSDPKVKASDLDSQINARVDKDGTFRVTRFMCW